MKLRLDSHLLPKVSAACFLWPRVEQLARRVWLTPALWESLHPCYVRFRPQSCGFGILFSSRIRVLFGNPIPQTVNKELP